MTPTREATAERAMQSRRFDTKDRTSMLRATIGVLQDLGYTIEESQDGFGMIVASRLAGAQIRAQIVVRAVPDANAITVRANSNAPPSPPVPPSRGVRQLPIPASIAAFSISSRNRFS